MLMPSLTGTHRQMSKRKIGTSASIQMVRKHQEFKIYQDSDPCLGRIPIIIDATQSPAFTVMETSAELLYLLRSDSRNIFGFKDPQEQSELQQWLFFWHGSGAPYQGNLSFFRRAEEQSPCKSYTFIYKPVSLTFRTVSQIACPHIRFFWLK